MALPLALPSTSNFLGVALVLNRNREGPRFVFHYPSRILTRPDLPQKHPGLEQVDDDFYDNDILGYGGHELNTEELARWNCGDHIETDSGTHFVPWEYVAGIPTKALEGILTPPRAFHKKRFQLLLDSTYYVSYPIHVPDNGFWDNERSQKGRPRKTRSRSDNAETDDRPHNDNIGDGKEEKVSSMNMFNLVFIFRPKTHEANDLLEVMYAHVIREVNKVYKYCQERGDFVWQECKKIIQLKDRARENKTKMSVLWDQVLSTSSLAASMRDVYEAVCRNKIAVLELSLGKGSVGHSVQIPMPFCVADVQPQGSVTARSLWLSTANTASSYDTLGGLAAFDRCTALLLTDDDDQRIISELQARRDKAATAMIELVRAAKPSLSFHQIVQLPDTNLTIQQVRVFAQHFIYWRRAMAVPPIHARDVYVLSPNCDISNVARASASFTETFPFAPPLADLLANLSAAPRPYKSFCPSKNLRPAYLRILAWLIRGGWVCQLCTFAYVVVWPEVQYEVEYYLESEALSRIKTRQHQAGKSRPKKADTDAFAGQDDDTSETGDVGDGDESSGASFELSSSNYSLRSQDKDMGTIDAQLSAAEYAAERARQQRMTEKAARSFAERATAHTRKPVPARTDHPSVNGAAHLTGMQPYIILDASKPTGRESLYLSTIEKHLRARRNVPPPASKKDGNNAHGMKTTANEASNLRHEDFDEIGTWNTHVAEMWPPFWKYFNGRSALERIPLLEETKRKDVWYLLSAMSEYMLCVRHW